MAEKKKKKKNEKTDFFFLYCLCTAPVLKAALYHESGTSPDAAVNTEVNKQWPLNKKWNEANTNPLRI